MLLLVNHVSFFHSIILEFSIIISGFPIFPLKKFPDFSSISDSFPPGLKTKNHVFIASRLIYIRAKAKPKATSFPLGSQGIQFTVYIKATAVATKIKEKEKNAFVFTLI